MDSLDVSLKDYWRSWDKSLTGKEWRSEGGVKDYWRWRVSEQPELDSRYDWYDWSDVFEIFLEVTLCLLVAILFLIIYLCFNKKIKQNLVDTENVWPEPPTYEDVIKKDNDELENQTDLPSYVDAVRLETEVRTKL